MRGSPGIHIVQTHNNGVSVMSDIRIQNNVIKDITGYAGWTSGNVKNIQISHNLFYRCNNNSWLGSQEQNTTFEDPNFRSEGVNFAGYAPTMPSGAIDRGAVISGYSYTGSAPDIGAIEVGQVIHPPELKIIGMSSSSEAIN
jgi:hypothetical protein